MLKQCVALQKRKNITKTYCICSTRSNPAQWTHHTKQTLLDFYKERRKKGLPVSVRVLYLKWCQSEPDMTAAISYTAARMRIYRFMERHQLSRRRATNHAQGLPTNQQLIEDFVSYINDKVKMLGIDDRRVVNFDKTNCYFSPDLSYTIADRGSRTVTIAKPESSQRCTVMLGGSLAGELFPPFVIFKGKNNGRIQEYCCKPDKHGWASGLFYRAQEKAWMDEASLMDWVLRVWAPWTETVGKPTLLILDEARAHMTANIRQLLNSMGTEVEYIPAKLTSKLQPMLRITCGIV